MSGDPASLADAVDDALQAGLREDVFSGAVAAVGSASGVEHLATVGYETAEEDAPSPPRPVSTLLRSPSPS